MENNNIYSLRERDNLSGDEIVHSAENSEILGQLALLIQILNKIILK